MQDPMSFGESENENERKRERQRKKNENVTELRAQGLSKRTRLNEKEEQTRDIKKSTRDC